MMLRRLICTIAVIAATASMTAIMAQQLPPMPSHSASPLSLRPDARTAGLFDTRTVRPIHPRARRSAASTPFKAPEVASKIYGSITYNINNDFVPGIYVMPTSQTEITSLEPLFTEPSMMPVGGGERVDDTYYSLNYMQSLGWIFTYLYLYDLNTGEMISTQPMPGDCLAMDVAYDPTTEYLYGCFYNENFDGYAFGRINPHDIENFHRETIRPLTTDERLHAVCFTPDGTMYTIDFNGVVRRTDKTTGEHIATVVNTGVTARYLGSGTIDPLTNILYWAVTDTDLVSSVYAIDLNNASVSHLYDLPEQAEIQGMFFGKAEADNMAPAAAYDLAVEFVDNSLTGNVTFTVPETTYNGTPQSGALSYTIKANETVIASGQTSYGAHASVPVTVTSDGLYTISVILTNNVGNSPKATIETYIGNDLPAAVTDVQATDTGSAVTLTWAPASGSVNGGYVDEDNLTYTVTRNDIMTEVVTTVATGLKETTFTDPYPMTEGIATLRYAVCADNNGVSSAPANSEVITVGHIDAPCLFDFPTEVAIRQFTIINANNDDWTWDYWNEYLPAFPSSTEYVQNFGAGVYYSDFVNTDDWLVTPPIRLEKGMFYQFSVDVKARGAGIAERFEVAVGNAPTVDAMLTQVIPATEVDNADYATFKGGFEAPETGRYYFGIHGCSDPMTWALLVDNIAVSAPRQLGVPDIVTNLTVTPDYDGALSAVVSFTAPTVNVRGETLEAIDYIEIRREGTLLKTLTDINPGMNCQWTDNAAIEGYNTYSIVAFNSYGEGLETSATAYVGINTPSPATNIVANETANPGEVTVTWTAPTLDHEGNPLNPSLLNYEVYEVNMENYGHLIETVQNNTTLTYRSCEADDEQVFISHALIATNEGGRSETALSDDAVPVGRPYELPYIESFARSMPSYILGIKLLAGWNAAWGIYNDASGIPSSDLDNGFMAMTGQYSGESSMLFTGKINLADCPNPALTFDYYGCGEDGQNTIDIMVNNGTGWVKHRTVIQAGVEDLWNKAVVPLDDFAGQIVRIGFAATLVSDAMVPIDCISIDTLNDTDLMLAHATAPSRVIAGQDVNIEATVFNAGRMDISQATLTLERNKVAVKTMRLPALASTETTKVTLTDVLPPSVKDNVTYRVILNVNDDATPENNTSETMEVFVGFSKTPGVENLIGEETSEGVRLSWEAPDLSKDYTLTEDFEDYKAFEHRSLGDWTLVDRDKAPVGVPASLPFGDIVYGSTQVAYVVVNPYLIGQYSYEFEPRSGHQFLASLFCAEMSQNNDWLISPRLSGNEQTIQFYARSYFEDYPETFSFRTSDKDSTSPNDFDMVEEHKDLSGDWTRYTVTIPAGTRRFAIVCTSHDKLMFLVDDIQYQPSHEWLDNLRIQGFNIYRNDIMIASVSADECSFTDRTASKDRNTFGVSVNYGTDESRAATVAVGTSGLDTTPADNIVISAAHGCIIITGADQKPVNIACPDGRSVFVSASGSSVMNVPVAPGLYIVRAGNVTAKLIVR